MCVAGAGVVVTCIVCAGELLPGLSPSWPLACLFLWRSRLISALSPRVGYSKNISGGRAYSRSVCAQVSLVQGQSAPKSSPATQGFFKVFLPPPHPRLTHLLAQQHSKGVGALKANSRSEGEDIVLRNYVYSIHVICKFKFIF